MKDVFTKNVMRLTILAMIAVGVCVLIITANGIEAHISSIDPQPTFIYTFPKKIFIGATVAYSTVLWLGMLVLLFFKNEEIEIEL